jgi:hypothetical protein
MLLLAGCGGTAADPFSRVPVTGELLVANQPVEFGSIYFRGAAAEKTQEVAQLQLPVRDGKFASFDDSYGTTPGPNEITVTVYATDPDLEEESGKETRVLGTYTGPVNVAEDEPIKINLEAGDLQRPSRN